MSLLRAFCVLFDSHGLTVDNHNMTGRHVLDAVFGKAQVSQCHAFAGGGKQRAFDGVTQRTHAQRIAGDKHLSASVQEDNVPGSVHPLG